MTTIWTLLGTSFTIIYDTNLNLEQVEVYYEDVAAQQMLDQVLLNGKCINVAGQLVCTIGNITEAFVGEEEIVCIGKYYDPAVKKCTLYTDQITGVIYNNIILAACPLGLFQFN